ncbi:hypothetical protein IE53DRAFT_384435 [Violaceomyces palustris]|uniref:Uncharacterized protein n=1 Tax=Violaceomyces palustris TaxID=1673888 RepID=A0ACD0P4Y3_9BASI|nr:hypothetical protein IE53DRAFT_384435 [Violaceomyces palustris]
MLDLFVYGSESKRFARPSVPAHPSFPAILSTSQPVHLASHRFAPYAIDTPILTPPFHPTIPSRPPKQGDGPTVHVPPPYPEGTKFRVEKRKGKKKNSSGRDG